LHLTDPHTKLDYASFWGVRNKIPDYKIPEQPASTVRQLQESLDFCKDRILRTRPQEVIRSVSFLSFKRIIICKKTLYETFYHTFYSQRKP
jgi:hypothetical protein